MAVSVIGPSGPNPADVSQSGDRLRVEFTPKVAGEYTIEIKVVVVVVVVVCLLMCVTGGREAHTEVSVLQHCGLCCLHRQVYS